MKTIHYLKKTKFARYLSVFVLLLSFQIGLVQSSWVQEALPLKPNDHLRVTVPSLNMKNQVVTYIELHERNIVVNADSTMDISLSSITRLDVSQGRKSKAGMGALIGAGVGAIVGGVFYNDVKGGFRSCPGCPYAFYGGGALTGAAVGALIGLAFKTERWEKVSS